MVAAPMSAVPPFSVPIVALAALSWVTEEEAAVVVAKVDVPTTARFVTFA